MAFTPMEASALSTAELGRVDQYEREIDAQIRTYAPHQYPTLYIFVGGGFSARVTEELTRRYEAVGWNVRWDSNWKDGTMLCLSTPKPASKPIGER